MEKGNGFMRSIKRISPIRLIAIGFALLIMFGAVLLTLPISLNPGCGISFLKALFTSTSAVCVTGLVAVDTADTFSFFGRTVIIILIQIGGLGVAVAGAGVMLLAHKRMGFKSYSLIRESMGLNSSASLRGLVRFVLLTTFIVEALGALLSFTVFVKDYPPLKALGISIFHSVSAFNNAGFDVLGGYKNLADYESNAPLCLITCVLIIVGGIGFLVINDIIRKKRFGKLMLHSKVVIATTAMLLVFGTVLIKATQEVSWLTAFFNSVTARTAGFSTRPLGLFTDSGLLVMILLMFVGASPGSTGGGVKTTSVFVVLRATISYASNRDPSCFKRRIPDNVIYKALTLIAFSVVLVMTGTLLLCLLEPEYPMLSLLFEVVSALATVGLSTGITPELCDTARFILAMFMYIGRLGPLTVAMLWKYDSNKSSARFSEENIML